MYRMAHCTTGHHTKLAHPVMPTLFCEKMEESDLEEFSNTFIMSLKPPNSLLQKLCLFIKVGNAINVMCKTIPAQIRLMLINTTAQMGLTAEL